MYVIIEQILDGSWDSVDLIGAYDTYGDAIKARDKRYELVSKDYSDWRGHPLDPEYTCCEDGYASVGYDGDGECIRWFVLDTNHPTTSYGVHKEG